VHSFCIFIFIFNVSGKAIVDVSIYSNNLSHKTVSVMVLGLLDFLSASYCANVPEPPSD